MTFGYNAIVIIYAEADGVTDEYEIYVEHTHTGDCYHYCDDTYEECYYESSYGCLREDCEDGTLEELANWHNCSMGYECGEWQYGECARCFTPLNRLTGPYSCVHDCPECVDGWVYEQMNDCQYGGNGTLICGY